MEGELVIAAVVLDRQGLAGYGQNRMKSPLSAAVVALCFVLSGGGVLAAETPSEPDSLPSWVLLGIGQRSAEQQLYGDAVVALRKSVDRRGVYPEAEAALAKIASLNGDPALQESLIEKALSEAPLLQFPEDRYALLYALADLRWKTSAATTRVRGERALETWRLILRDDKVYSDAQEAGGLEGYYNALMAAAAPIVLKTATGPGLTQSFVGLNRVLYLYRHPLTFSLLAHQKVAQVSLENKAYRLAVSEALFALTGIFSTVIDEVRVFAPEYVFRDLKELFVDANSEVYLGRPGLPAGSTTTPGGSNPGWLVRYQPIWNYLNEAGLRSTLETLARALEGLAEQEKTAAPERTFRPAAEVAAEVRQWQKIVVSQGVR